MPIELPDLEELTQRLVDAFKGAFPEDDIAVTGDNFKRLRINALAGLQVNANLFQLENDLLPDKAADVPLDRWGFIVGVPRKLATPARKADAGRVVGTVGSTGSIGDQLTSEGGLIFQTNENFTIPAAGFLDVDIIGVSTGSQTQLQRLEILRYTSPPAGIEQEVELQLALDEDGTDRESNGAYRVRVLNALQQPAAGGNANDWSQQFALPQEGVETAFVFPLRRGRGSVDLAVLHAGSGTVRPFTTNERDELFSIIDLLRPVTQKSFRILETTTSLQNVEITIVPLSDLSFQFDWDDTGVFTVAAYVAATKTLTFGGAGRPTDLIAGDRIVIRTDAADGTGEVLVVEQLGSGDDVILNKDPTPTPVSPDRIFAAGPLTNPVRDAILALIDAFGPARGLFAAGDWQSDLIPEQILASVFRVEGIRDGTVITPAAPIVADDPAFPLDATIELLIPREILVRRQL